MKTYSIALLRNGRMQGAEKGQYIGHTDVPLSEAGKEQLEKQRKAYDYPAVQAVFSSPLKRCIQTAQILYPGQQPLIIPDLIEYNFGEFERKTAQELEKHPVFPAWLAGEAQAEPPFGESMAAFASRVQRGFTQITEGLLKTGTTRAAIVTHGGVMMHILQVFGLPEMPMHAWRSETGCGYLLRVTPSVWSRGQKLEVVQELPQK